MKYMAVGPNSAAGPLSRCGMHLMEASVAIRDKYYFEFYKDLGRRGYWITVDNGAAEATKVEGTETEDVPDRTPPNFEWVIELAKEVNASEIILPDRKLDSYYTLEQSLKWLPAIPLNMKAAFVPQGKNLKEWTECLRKFMVKIREPFHTVCITKDYENPDIISGGRLEMLKRLTSGWFMLNKYDIHLLGLWGKHGKGVQWEVERYKYLARSIDTGAPVAYAQSRMYLTHKPERFSLDWDAEPDCRILHENLDLIWRWCSCT